jgi:ParB-like chromosome segregation protein Spo0J
MEGDDSNNADGVELIEAAESYKAAVAAWRSAASDMRVTKSRRTMAEKRVGKALSSRGGESSGIAAPDPSNVMSVGDHEIRWGTSTKIVEPLAEKHVRAGIAEALQIEPSEALVQRCVDASRKKRRTRTSQYVTIVPAAGAAVDVDSDTAAVAAAALHGSEL